jgi:transketolase
MAPVLDEKIAQILKDIAHNLRIHSIEATIASNSGHPTSCSSMADILSVLFFHTMRYTVKDPRNANSDRFVLSKGHAAPVLYAAWAEAGLFPVSDLKTLRKIDSTLDGHPTPNSNFIDVATGSLGQGLSCAAGMAYTGKYLENADYRVYCLIGDGESAEGSIWEAMAFASRYKLDNLVNIIDVNRLGQSEPTMYQHHMDVYKKRAEAFGWNAIVIDGHDINEIVAALDNANSTKGQPTCIIAKTFKGKYMPGIEDDASWHGKPLPRAKGDEVIAKIKELIKNQDKLGYQMLSIREPEYKLTNVTFGEPMKLSKLPNYKLGDQIATRLAYGNALVNIGATNKRIIACDGDVKNSTFSIKFKEAYPDRFVEAFIAEQNLVGVAIGCSTRFRTVPFVSTFAAFFSRAFDQIRMGAISLANVKFAGSHVGVSIGEDGPSQMALEDLSMFRAIPSCVVFYPSDAVSTEYAVELSANYRYMCYIRTSRPNTTVLYANDEKFEIGKAKIVLQSDDDYCTVVGGGITVHEAIKASKSLKGKSLRVIDLFTIKPIDWKTVHESVLKTNNRLIVVEDHYREGGIGEALMEEFVSNNLDLSGLKYKHLYVKEIPKSGTPNELIAKYKIDADAITATVETF